MTNHCIKSAPTLISDRKVIYSNDPKFSERQIQANSVDPDQTASEVTVWPGSALFVILSLSFGYFSAR